MDSGHFFRVQGRLPELGFSFSQALGFQLGWLAFGFLAHQKKIPEIGDENLTVFTPTPGNLLPVYGAPGVFRGGLDFDDPPGRGGAGDGLRGGLLELVRGEEAAVREAGAPVFQADDTLDFGLEGFAHFVEQGR